jgi:hypothetical protein
MGRLRKLIASLTQDIAPYVQGKMAGITTLKKDLRSDARHARSNTLVQ